MTAAERLARGAETRRLLAELEKVQTLAESGAPTGGPRLVWDRDGDPEQQAARLAAAQLRAVLAGTAPKPKITGVMHADARPKYYWFHTYATMPGLSRITSGSTRGNAPTKVVYNHALLPGWDYLGRELAEMAEDLENLAAGRGQPVAPTRKA